MEYDVTEYPPQNGNKWGWFKCSAHEPVGKYYKKLATLQPANIDTKWNGEDQNKHVSDIIKYPENKSDNGIPH